MDWLSFFWIDDLTKIRNLRLISEMTLFFCKFVSYGNRCL